VQPQQPQTFQAGVVVGDDRPALAAGEVLGGVEREAGGVAQLPGTDAVDPEAAPVALEEKIVALLK